VIELIPVVEMAGWSYSDRPAPTSGTRFEDPEAWDRYHRLCLADAGVTGLTAIAAGSTHFRASELVDVALLRLVAHALSDFTPEPGGLDVDGFVEEYITGIAGGLVLRNDGTIVVEPGCCCGLESIGDWCNAVAASDWKEIWVGHDERRLEARADDAGHLFRWAAWGTGDWSDPIRATRDDVEQALRETRRQLERLADRIIDVLPPSVDARWQRAVARQLAGASNR